MQRPHEVSSDHCTHLEVIPQHGNTERHQPFPAFFKILGVFALFAVLALNTARERREAILGEKAEEGEYGCGEKLRLLVGDEGGVLGQDLEQALVAAEGHAAEEGDDEGREPRRRGAGELRDGEEKAGAGVREEEGEREGEEGGSEGRVEGGEAGAGGVEGDEEAARERGGVGEEGEGEREGQVRGGEVGRGWGWRGEEEVGGDEGVLRRRGGGGRRVVVADGEDSRWRWRRHWGTFAVCKRDLDFFFFLGKGDLGR